MAKTADQSQVFLYDLDGETVEVAREHRDAFLQQNPGARGVGLYEAGGETVEVADGDLDAFRKANPTAERVHLFDQPDGETVEVARKDVPAYIGSRAAPDKDRSWGSYAGEAYSDAGRAVAEGARKVAGAVSGAAEVAKDAGKAVGQAVETVASNAADVARRIPAAAEGFLDRAAVAPVLLAGRVADAINPDPLAGPVDVLTGERGRFSPQEMGYAEDPYRQGLASRTADRARAWLARRDEARAPTTPAGRVADVPVQFGTTLVGYSTPVGPLAMVGNAAQAGDRAYAEGASGAQALGRTAASLAAQAAAFGPKPIPVPGANAAGRAVEGAAARIGGRVATTPEGAARAVRTAVTAGQVARGAVESGARMAGVTAAEGGDAKDVLIAAGVGGAVGGALRGLSTRPLARVAGEAAGRMARGGVDTPPPRMDPAGLAANRAEATVRTPEGDAALARANAGLASPERAGLPAPAEPGAVPTVYGQRTIVPPYYGPTVSRPGEPIAPPAPVAESPAAPRRVTGRPRELSTMHENGNSTTLATMKNRAEKGVLPVEIVVRPNGMGVSRAGQFDANEPVVLFRYESDGADSLGYPVFGNTERILDWARESGLADRAGVSTVEPAPVAESATPPRDFALDGGTPAEIDAEKARAAEVQKRAALEEEAAAPGRDLGTVTIQEGLPGIGGDGTLFTPPAGGWSGRVASGPVRGDVAAETPRLAGTAAGVKPATPDGPRAAIRSELQVLLDSGERDPATLEDLARRAEAADAFETAALARQAAGTYRGTPWGTEGGSWPAEEPPAARATVGDLVQLVKSMGDGSAPAVMRRIARHPNWAGVFRGEEGAPESGRIGIITKMARLVDDSQKARIREEAARKAAETGEDPATVYASMMVRAIRENAAAGPKPLQAVLAHEIGHFLDFLDEGTLKRGNVLGHLAALKKYMARTLFPTKAAADAAGAPGLTAAEVKAAAKEWKVPESEARRRLVEERDLLTHPEIRREMESLVAWFRQTDGAPDYFRNDPAELYAEAFSAWVNYPAETARRAPEFAAALEGWMDARPEAARALEEFRSGITQRAARAAVERGDTTDPAFFAAQEREAEAARWWQRRKAAAAANLRPQTARQRVKAFGDALRVSLTGPLNVIRSDLMASGAGQAFRPENLPLWRAMRQAENAPNLAALWDYRFKAFVEPELEGAPYTAFLNYLKHYRIATELLGKDLDRGRMNLPNPGGVTPGDITRDGVNQATSSAAWIHALQRDQPELYAKLERARKAFWEKVRNGRDDLGGDGSPMQVVRDTPVLSKEQKEQLLGNEGYVSFSEKDLPDPSRRMGSEEQSLWDGIFSQRTGTFKEPGDVVANTIRGDYNLMRRLGQMELALRTVDWLRANKPELVGGQAETKMDPASGRLYVEQGTKPGMRTVSFLRDGKPEGWYVPVAYAEAVEMPGRGERSWDGIMGVLSKVKRGLNAMQTSWNPVFNTNNSWAKDPQSLALRLPNWRVRGHGLLGGTARALGNVFGHYGEQLASYLDNSGRDYARGKYNPDTARALAWGAVNNAAPGSTAYADAQGGGVGVLEGRLRDRGLEGQTLDDAARRQILKARGLTEEQIDAGLRSAEGTLEKWAKAWDSMGRVARGARLLYPRILSQLQHGEIRTKSYALKRILAERPDLSREEAVEIARQQIGTPDMANKPAIDRNPALGALLFQYFTPRVHGWVDQLVGAMRRGWTGGTREQATKFTRLVALTAAMSVPFLILRDAIQTYRHADEEEGKARARGDLAAAERFAEEKEKARARARSIQAISSRDLFTKVFAFAGDGRALGFSVDPTVTPITTAVLGSLFGREWGVKPGDALREGVGTEILPGFAPLFTAAWGNLRGFDPNTGRPIGGGEDADLLDRLSWTAETLTGRALGTGAFSYARELAAPKDDAKSEERRSRQDVPILSAAWRPFWRKTGYGLVERAAAMREEQKRVNALVGAIAERYARGQPVSEEDARWFAQHAAQPGESVRAAAERVWKLRNMTPDQRAADSLSRRSRREIEEEFGYIAPPRLTDEDRAR